MNKNSEVLALEEEIARLKRDAEFRNIDFEESIAIKNSQLRVMAEKVVQSTSIARKRKFTRDYSEDDRTLGANLKDATETLKPENSQVPSHFESAISIIEDFIMTDDHADFCRPGLNGVDCSCMDRSHYNHAQNKNRAKKFLSDIKR